MGAVPLGCKCSKEEPLPAPQETNLGPLPAPSGLLAEIFVPNPDAAWTKARASLAGPAMFLPGSVSTLVVTMLGLPMSASTEIDGQVPIVGALVERPEGGRPKVVLGVHVRAGYKIVDAATKGENARLRSNADAKTGITLLEPKDGGERPVVVGVFGNYLLVSQSKADLLEVGPYVARTLPSAKMAKDDATIELPREALSGPIASGLRSGWETLRPKPRALEGDKKAALSSPPLPNPLNGLMESLVALVGELEHARVAVNFDDKAMHVKLVGMPLSGGEGAGRVARMSVADPRRVLDLPADSEVAIFLHDEQKARVEDAKSYTKTFVASLGQDVPEADRAAIESTLVAVAEGRGDAFAVGVTLLSTGPAAYVRSDIANADVLSKGLDDLLGLTKLPSVGSWLSTNQIAVTSGKTVLENVPGDVHRIRLERLEEGDAKAEGGKPAGKAAKKASEKKDAPRKDGAADPKQDPALSPPSTIDMLYMLDKAGLVLAAGVDAKVALRAVLDAPSKENLASRADVKAAINGVGESVAFVAFVDPLRLLARRAAKPLPAVGGPVVFSLGKGGEGESATTPWMRLDVAGAALQELMKHRGAL